MGPTDRLFCPVLARQGPLICGRRLELSGWALLAAGVTEVRVAVGDREQVADLEPDGTLEITTPDSDEGAVGFSVEADLGGLEAGEHVLTLTASGPGGEIAQEGTVQVVPHDVVEGDAMAPVRAGRPSMAVNAAIPSWPMVDIAAWLWPANGLQTVTFVLDRRHRYAIAPERLVHRPDVAQVLEAAGVENEGRNGVLLKLDVRGQPPGAQHLLVVCAWADGTVIGAESSIEVDYAPDWTPATALESGDAEDAPPAWPAGTGPPTVPSYPLDVARLRDRVVQAEALVRELRLNQAGELSRRRLVEGERDAALASLAELQARGKPQP